MMFGAESVLRNNKEKRGKLADCKSKMQNMEPRTKSEKTASFHNNNEKHTAQLNKMVY